MSDTKVKSPQRKLQENIRVLRERMAEACQRAGRSVDGVRLIAVTKMVEVDVIRMAIEQGLLDLAENRVQELCRRAAMVAESARRRRMLDKEDPRRASWHMVGHLQRNKVKKVLEWSTVIHSVDSLRLAEEISKEAAARNSAVDILLEINVAAEKSKHGLSVGAVDVVVEQVGQLPGLNLVGLMTMAPLVADPEEARSVFARLREIAEELKERQRVAEHFRELSMGMTNDFEVAIEEGATMIRVGTALFEGLFPDQY